MAFTFLHVHVQTWKYFCKESCNLKKDILYHVYCRYSRLICWSRYQSVESQSIVGQFSTSMSVESRSIIVSRQSVNNCAIHVVGLYSDQLLAEHDK